MRGGRGAGGGGTGGVLALCVLLVFLELSLLRLEARSVIGHNQGQGQHVPEVQEDEVVDVKNGKSILIVHIYKKPEQEKVDRSSDIRQRENKTNCFDSSFFSHQNLSVEVMLYLKQQVNDR